VRLEGTRGLYLNNCLTFIHSPSPPRRVFRIQQEATTMTLAEFKAWFSGFTESMDSTPNEKQWARIKARVDEIDGVAITKTVYVDRYIERHRQPYWYYSVNDLQFGGITALSCAGQNSNASAQAFYSAIGNPGGTGVDRDFNSHSAMLDLGKAEFLAVQ
jgi:hypothetical protein